MRPLILLLLFSLFPFASGADNPTLIDNSDLQMNAAIVRARNSLPSFLELKDRSPSGVSNYTVKVLFTSGATREHMWVIPFRRDGAGRFQGILKSEPRFLPGLTWGQQVTFSQDQITDWGYTMDGKQHGFFTVCALISRNPEFRKRMQAEGRMYECAV